MSFATEPAHQHGRPTRTAVMLCNLGTPEAPTPQAVRRYLAEFLSDRRVVEIPRLLWLLILHGAILRVRPARSAKKYASIWTAEGSPLKVWTEKQARLLGDAEIACMGPVTADTARKLGLQVAITAREYTTHGLVQAIAEGAVKK